MHNLAQAPAFAAQLIAVTDPKAIPAQVRHTTPPFGGVKALKTTDGTCVQSDGPDMPAPKLDRQMQINVRSAFHCSQQAIKAMLPHPGIRKIVTIPSNGT